MNRKMTAAPSAIRGSVSVSGHSNNRISTEVDGKFFVEILNDDCGAMNVLISKVIKQTLSF